MSEKQLIIQLENRLNALEMENKQLHETVAFLTKKLYGQSSEKTSVLSKNQMSLFNEAEKEASPKAIEPDLGEVKNYQRKKFKGQKAELLKELPHKKILTSLHEDDRYCEQCGTDLISVGEEFIRTEIEFIPAKVQVIDYYRETFECRCCRKNGNPYMEKAPMPYPVIQHSMASPSTVAWIIHQKFVNALPLYRQEKEWKTLGVNLSRATMANWLIISARDWLTPIYERMHQMLLGETHLHVDETTVQVMKEKGRKDTSISYMWVYSTGKYSKRPIRFFEYQPSRSGKNPTEFLNGFEGYLHTDAYAGYNQVPNVTRCYCWAHLRRKYVDAMPQNHSSKEAGITNHGIDYCNKLFALEKQLEHLNTEERKQQRLKQEKPILDAYWSWVDETINSGEYLPKGKLAAALNYTVNQKDGLMNYLRDGDCSISNNLAENSIRPFTVGRKNWLFSGSPKGAQSSAIIYSMVETAKANSLEPYKYIKYIFSNFPGVQYQNNLEFIDDFLPWSDEIQQFCR